MAHGKEGAPALDWAALRDPRQTLVFYMGLTWSAEVSRGLVENGRAAQSPVAIIENGTRVEQRVLLTTLGSLTQTVVRGKPVSPSLLVVGDVVNLYQRGASAPHHPAEVSAEPRVAQEA
ncbi:MAG: uroporphyrinogen-III C-methyltransferase [Sodalis sp. (in: enterobacteria)]|uniref:uroporphyrinogen-III C-methyltransferase n=1 Tax=Sodalis sp. (in: enterobacteria) TaxID=1898979 RepID=UPI003F3DB612